MEDLEDELCMIIDNHRNGLFEHIYYFSKINSKIIHDLQSGKCNTRSVSVYAISFSKNPCHINLKPVVLAKSIPCGIPASK